MRRPDAGAFGGVPRRPVGSTAGRFSGRLFPRPLPAFDAAGRLPPADLRGDLSSVDFLGAADLVAADLVAADLAATAFLGGAAAAGAASAAGAAGASTGAAFAAVSGAGGEGGPA
ncbi:hypothetical protein [Rhodococcus erythropolis]|uniref:hypothetical protein n=1 Tax=Rhodococcus erythropolis TaxID=1833 RepID=UPI0018E96E1C